MPAEYIGPGGAGGPGCRPWWKLNQETVVVDERIDCSFRWSHNYLPAPFHANYDLNVAGLCQNVVCHTQRDWLTVVVGGGYGEGRNFDHGSIVVVKHGQPNRWLLIGGPLDPMPLVSRDIDEISRPHFQ